MSALRVHDRTGRPILIDLGPATPARLPGWHAHDAHPLGSQLLGESSGGAGQPTKPNRVGDAEILLAQRVASEKRRRASEQRADAAYRARNLEAIRAKDRARKTKGGHP